MQKLDMGKKERLLGLVLMVIIVTSVGVVYFNNLLPLKKKGEYKPGVDYETDQAVTQAKKIFKDKQNLGVDFSNGPCLTNDLMTNWAADIVRNPRVYSDDFAENQCPSVVEGRVKNVVELDLEGDVVGIK